MENINYLKLDKINLNKYNIYNFNNEEVLIEIPFYDKKRNLLYYSLYYDEELKALIIKGYEIIINKNRVKSFVKKLNLEFKDLEIKLRICDDIVLNDEIFNKFKFIIYNNQYFKVNQ